MNLTDPALEGLLESFRSREAYEDLGRGATADEIEEIEATLGLTLPDEYRAFLERCGYVFWFGNSICGVASDPADSVIHQTERARSMDLPPDFGAVPRDALAVKEYGGGGWYLLFSAESPRAGQVSLILDETFYQEEQSWPTFAAFLRWWAR